MKREGMDAALAHRRNRPDSRPADWLGYRDTWLGGAHKKVTCQVSASLISTVVSSLRKALESDYSIYFC